MQKPQVEQEYDLNKLETKMNSYDWFRIDTNLNPLPSNPYYQVVIEDKETNLVINQAQKYYQRFRLIMQNQDTHFLPQTLALTSYLLKASTNNFYALMLRRKYIFKELSIDADQKDKIEVEKVVIKNRKILKRQLNFMNNLLEDNPKQYHIWTYKKDLISRILPLQANQNLNQQTSLNELSQFIYMAENKFIFSLLIQDCRNYHAWDYRFWLVTYLDHIEAELNLVKDLIAQRNTQNPVTKKFMEQLSTSDLQAQELKPNWVNVNSLWSHKFNLIKYLHQQNSTSQKLTQEYVHSDAFKNSNTQSIPQLVDKEIMSSIQLIQEDNKNQCVWNYLRGMIKFEESNYPDNHIKSHLNLIKQKIYRLESWDQTDANLDKFNRFELSFLKSLISKIKPQKEQQVLNNKIIAQLKTIDIVRLKYYDYLQKNTRQK